MVTKRNIKMHQITFLLTSLYTITECANLQRYGESTTRYSGYTTTANLYNQPYKAMNYGNDISTFPEATRYPNMQSGYSTSGYNSYNTPGYQQSGYSTSRISQDYGNNGKGYQQSSGYSTPQYVDGFKSYSGQGGYKSLGNYNGQGNYNGLGYTSYEVPFMKNIMDYCINRSPQMGISIRDLMGFWYGVEVIQHLGGDSVIDYTRTCIQIHISEPKDRPSTQNMLHHVQAFEDKFWHDFRHLRLLWDEAGQTIEFSLFFRNDSAGYWTVYGSQNGTLPQRSNYNAFSGSVQVLKAVNDHLVLSFCQEPKAGRTAQLYSVLFSREPALMPYWEVESVHNMLQAKGLSVASRRMVCGNSASRHYQGFLFSSLTCLLAFLIGSS